MKSLQWITFFSCLALTQACGGDGGVDRSKSYGSLSVSEAKEMCEELEASASAGDALKVGCHLAAVFAQAFDPNVDCDMFVQECIADAEMAGCEFTQAELDAEPACADMITVGEYMDCMVDTFDAAATVADQISCIDLSALDMLPTDSPASCQSIETKCPELLEL